MNFQQRKDAFVKLGEFLMKISGEDHPKFFEAYHHNNWFTPENIKLSTRAWADQLITDKLDNWLSPYHIGERMPKNIAIIMAGNIPLVGFHDLLCVLLSGNKAIVRFSEDDKILTKFLIDELLEIEPGMAEFISISEDRLPKNFEAVIATGSNNTNRYFEYYFRNKPALLRKSRNSVAILTGQETTEEISKLGDDIFTYFGLGCRNVSKIYVPGNYNMSTFFEGIEHYKSVLLHHKYTNNYHYHKSIFLLNLAPHLDNNFVIVKEDETIASPLGVLFIERYSSLEMVFAKLREKKNDIQCVVSKTNFEGSIPFGRSQSPELYDYADGVDTIKFLMDLAPGV